MTVAAAVTMGHSSRALPVPTPMLYTRTGQQHSCWWQTEAGGLQGSPHCIPQPTPPPRHEGRQFVNEPELRLGRREGIIPESSTGCPKQGQAGTHGSPCAGTRVLACTRCPFSLVLSNPVNSPGAAAAGAEEPGFGGRWLRSLGWGSQRKPRFLLVH